MSIKNKIKTRIRVLKEEEENKRPPPSLLLNPYSQQESPFCEHNPKVNKFAQSSPDNLATTLIFVVATILRAWPLVLDRFPYLMSWIHIHNGIYDKDAPALVKAAPQPPSDRTNVAQMVAYQRALDATMKIPATQTETGFLSLATGKKFVPQAIHYIWRMREQIYAQVGPLLNSFNNAQTNEDRNHFASEIYKTFLGYPFLGLPKAAFATQLVIGRYGCIDSINLQVLPEKSKNEYLALFDKDKNTGEIIGFKSPAKIVGTEKELGRYKRGDDKTDLANLYIRFMDELENTLSAGSISKILWDAWCDMVGYKILNPASGKFTVGGAIYGKDENLPYPEVSAEKGYGIAGSKEYLRTSAPDKDKDEKFTPQEVGKMVSRQHYELPAGTEVPALVTPDNPDYRKLVSDPKAFDDYLKDLQKKEKEREEQRRKQGLKEAIKRKVLEILKKNGISHKMNLKQIIKEEIQRALEETSTMAGGNVEGGATKSPFGSDTISMIEKHKKPKGISLAGRMMEKKKIKLTKEEMNPATDPKTMAGDTGGMGRASVSGGIHSYEDEEEVIMEYLTEAEASAKKPRLGKVTRNPSGSKKKFHVYVKCGGKVKKISFGDPNLSIKRDSPERRKSFRARHKCDKPEGKNRCTARYWSCYQWRAGARVKSEE